MRVEVGRDNDRLGVLEVAGCGRVEILERDPAAHPDEAGTLEHLARLLRQSPDPLEEVDHREYRYREQTGLWLHAVENPA